MLDYESVVVRVDPADLGVVETIEGIPGGSSDVGSGMAIGADAVWVTGPEAVTRVSL